MSSLLNNNCGKDFIIKSDQLILLSFIPTLSDDAYHSIKNLRAMSTYHPNPEAAYKLLKEMRKCATESQAEMFRDSKCLESKVFSKES